MHTKNAESPATPAPVHARKRLRGRIAGVARWLHIYLSMASFAVILFFSVTGITLNHPDWFPAKQQTAVHRGTVEKALLGAPAGIDRLALAEWFRAHEKVHGSVGDFRIDDGEIEISFRAPGYTADAFIDRQSGKYELTEVASGFVAAINDLHKGRDAGRVWKIAVDASAVLLTLVSATGLFLIWFLYRRRSSGLILAGIGLGLLIVLYRLGIS